MGSLSWIHWLIIIAVVLVLFGGGGKISGIMGDFAKGIKAFKKGLNEDDKGDDDKGGGAPSQKLEAEAKNAQAREKDHASV